MGYSSRCDNAVICDLLMKDEVVVMEDSISTRQVVEEVIKNELNWQVRTINNKEEAVSLVERKEAAFYILDNWIDDNKNEGLKALEQIRAVDKKVFVAIFSGYPHPDIKKKAKNLEANFFKSKSLDTQKDIQEIASEMIRYRLKILQDFETKEREKLKKLDWENSDRNIIAYEELKLDKKWLAKYKDKYVAFVDGKLVDSDDNKQALLKRLRNSEYRDKLRFITKVEKTPRIVDEPSSLWLDIV